MTKAQRRARKAARTRRINFLIDADIDLTEEQIRKLSDAKLKEYIDAWREPPC